MTFDPNNDDWADFATGKSGDIVLEGEFLRTVQRMYELFVRKNHDYGNENISSAWLPGIIIRLGDKISRLWTLYGIGKDDDTPVKVRVASESKADTFMDIANYAVLGYLMEMGYIKKAQVQALYGKKALAKILAQIYAEMDDPEQLEILEYIMAAELARDLKAKVVLDD